MTCPDCAISAEPSQGCTGCRAQALANLFLAKGERGLRFRRACEQLGVSEERVKQVHAEMLPDLITYGTAISEVSPDGSLRRVPPEEWRKP